METMNFKIVARLCINKSDVFDYYEAEDIEYDPDTAEPTDADFKAAADMLVAEGMFEIVDIIPV